MSAVIPRAISVRPTLFTSFTLGSQPNLLAVLKVGALQANLEIFRLLPGPPAGERLDSLVHGGN
jgi:hypothetical protein